METVPFLFTGMRECEARSDMLNLYEEEVRFHPENRMKYF